MKRRFKIMAVTFSLLLVISLGLNIVLAVGQGAEPGSDQDPIVSKSYVDAAVIQLTAKIQALLEQNDILKNQNTQLTTRLTTQEQAVKALQEELKTIKSSVSAGTGSTGGSSSTGAGSSTTTPTASSGTAKVNVAVLNVRAQTNTTSAIYTKIVLNETVTLVSKSGEWYKIKTSKGVVGYVMGKFLTAK